VFDGQPDSRPNKDEGVITLYRGVNPNNDYFNQALQGVAVPLDMVSGHTDPARHNGGDTHSIFTSWTFRPKVAARMAGQYGVVLVQKFKLKELVPSPDKHNEQEILM
jgi:hypothetical protein